MAKIPTSANLQSQLWEDETPQPNFSPQADRSPFFHPHCYPPSRPQSSESESRVTHAKKSLRQIPPNLPSLHPPPPQSTHPASTQHPPTAELPVRTPQPTSTVPPQEFSLGLLARPAFQAMRKFPKSAEVPPRPHPPASQRALWLVNEPATLGAKPCPQHKQNKHLNSISPLLAGRSQNPFYAIPRAGQVAHLVQFPPTSS